MAGNNIDAVNLIPFESIHPSEYLYRWFTIHVTDTSILDELSSNRRYRKTPEIEQYPCRVFLVDFDFPKRIRVWLNEQEIQINKCSDYMFDRYTSDEMEPCWVCKWIEVEKYWLIDPSEVIDETTIDKPDFYRLHGDRHAEFGDGGEAFLFYPVWIQEQLPVTESRRQRLLSIFHQLNDERKDFHASPSPVEDIIDPDLLAYRPPATFERNQWIARKINQLETPNDRKLRDFKRDLGRGEYDTLSEHEQLRDTYQWLPSEFVIDQHGKVDIVTPIHHLPPLPKYRQAYGDIAHIFHAMLPMFEKLKLIKLNPNEEQRLQVIVKAQSYNLKAGKILSFLGSIIRITFIFSSGMKYSGRWHTEGQTENIIAVGVYYLHIDDQLEGGALKFRPAYAPQNYYPGIETDYEVSSVQSGTAVVFSNAIPHRFRQIRNLTTDDGRRRTFLNFFIVDPEQAIDLKWKEIVFAPQDQLIKILREWNDGRLPDIILEKILRMLGSSVWETEDDAKEFRSLVRRAMLEEKTGWGWICYGNCGTTEFVRSLCAWPPREREEIRDGLQHTESE